MKKSSETAPGPLSVNLPVSARRGLLREARRRGLPLSTAVRALALERIEQLQQEEGLTRAETWQRAQAWATWDRIRAGDRREVSRLDLDSVFGRARSRRK